MLPEIYAKTYGFPQMFYHRGMIYEWSGQCFSDMSALVFEAKAPPNSNISVADVMETVPGDPSFTMLIAIYYGFTVIDVDVRTQIIDDDTHVYVTCYGSRSRDQYRAWNESNYPLFTTDVCAPTHLLVKTVQPYCEAINLGWGRTVEVRGEMYSELRKPMNWVDEYRFIFGYGINVHCGIEGYQFLTQEAEDYFNSLKESDEGKKKSDLLPIDPATNPVIQKRIMDSVSYHLGCLSSFLSPLHTLKIKFEISWIDVTSQYFNTRNLDMVAIVKAGLINDVFVKACTLFDMTVEPICHSGQFFGVYAHKVDWGDIYHSIGRIYTALQSNSGLLMMSAISNREIIYADNKQYIGTTILPMPINFAEPSIPHKDSAEIVRFIEDLQPYFFFQDEHCTDFAFPVTNAVQDDFILLFARMDMYYARSGGLEEFRKKINCHELGIEVLADTSTYLYFAVVDMHEVETIVKELSEPNKMSFNYSFCGFYGFFGEWEEISLIDSLKYLISLVSQSSTPERFIIAEDPLYKAVRDMCKKSNVYERECPAFAWEQNVGFMTRDKFQSAWCMAMHQTFDPGPITPNVAKVLTELEIDPKYWGRFRPDSEEKDDEVTIPVPKTFWGRISARFRKKK